MEWTASTTQFTVLIALAVVSVDAIRRLVLDRIERKGYPLPPGPTPLPLLGSALSLNMDEPFRTYTEWRAKYGDIMYIRLLDMDVVVLNSLPVILDLLEKRSEIYSDRPHIASSEPYGYGVIFSLSKYGDHLRACRRMFHQTFGADVAIKFRPIQLRKARQMILTLIDDPVDYTSHYWTFAVSVAMGSIYDYDPKPKNDEMVKIITNFLETSLPALMPGMAVLLKTFPFLLHVPDWLPGSSIQREARKCRELSDKMVNAPYQNAKKRVESGNDTNTSLVTDHISQLENLESSDRFKYENVLKSVSSTAFLGSVESTSSTLLSFTLAMVENPHVWKRAQAEIDNVVGIDRLPEFYDRPSLPYVDAIIREALRWQPVVPLAPHATITSDIYNGFYIPKGAMIFPNVWGLTRDESQYPNAEKFKPERFLDPDGMLTEDTVEYVFGFGRRVCPGRYVAGETLWSVIVTMLASLDFNRAKDAEGKDVSFEVKWMNGLARHPLSFPCCITPRSHVSKSFVKQALSNDPNWTEHSEQKHPIVV